MQTNKMLDIGYKEMPFLKKLRLDFERNKSIYPIALIVVAYFVIFHYIPMYGLTIAFQDYSPFRGFIASPWVGFKHFVDFIESPMLYRTMRNTFTISLTGLVVAFPMPIVFALAINEIASNKFKRTIQTISYIPHFISIVVVCGMIIDFFSITGVVNQLLGFIGISRINFMGESNWFLPIFIGSGIWQGVGYGSILYLAAICSVDTELYDALIIDGGGRIRRVWNIILPSILPTILVMLILRLGNMMVVDFEKVILLQNSLNASVSEVISTLTYKAGILGGKYSASTAIGLFNTVINLAFLIIANRLSKKIHGTSLW